MRLFLRSNGRPVPPGFFACALVLALVGAAPTAAAKLGDGLKMGPGRLRLGVELEGRFDSLVVNVQSSTGTTPAGDVITKPRLAAALELPGQSLRANVNASVDWNQYLGALGADTRTLSFLGANLAGTLVFNPNTPFSVEIGEALQRTDRTSNPVYAVGVLGIHNETSLRARLRPGGGALDLAAGYVFIADIFSNQVSITEGNVSIAKAEAGNAYANRVELLGRWRFLPKTGLILDIQGGQRGYFQSVAGNSGAFPVRAMLGLGTLLTTRLTFALKGGYDGIFLSGQSSVQTWAAAADLGWLLTETFQVRLGFQRLTEPVALYGAYGDMRGFLLFRAQLNRVVLTADASADFIEYAGSGRQDQSIAVNVRGEYNVNDWLRFYAAVAISTRGVKGDTQEATSGSKDFGNLNRQEISVGVATLF